jgi:hypothetical protein
VPFRFVLFSIKLIFLWIFSAFLQFFSRMALHFCIYWFFQNGVLQSLDLHLLEFWCIPGRMVNLQTIITVADVKLLCDESNSYPNRDFGLF